YYLLPAGQRPAKTPVVPAGATVEYICPMDPEVLETKPGACPICGMALEPKVVSLLEGPNPELEDMSRRFWWSLGPAVLVMILAMSDMLPATPLHHQSGGALLN